jgi:hypothetical protein
VEVGDLLTELGVSTVADALDLDGGHRSKGIRDYIYDSGVTKLVYPVVFFFY